jgi:hypothetical protein
MPTYEQLAQESYWTAEFEAPAHAELNDRLRGHFGHTRSQTGSKGDNRHLDGRHRSRKWILHSRFCSDPNRDYGTRDERDLAGDGDWLRATDLGVQGAALRAVSARVDRAVRAGLLPAVAEWFGTIDGRTVVGWYEGHPSSADDSHLYHFHFGLWTGSCNDADQLRLLGDIITGRGRTPMLGIKKGDKGDEVELLQTLLTAAGFTVTIDGTYGASTAAAVLALRKSVGSKADSGDAVTPAAYEQILRVHAARQAKPGPTGPRGPAGPAGPAGPPGRDGLGVGDAVTVTGAITATA